MPVRVAIAHKVPDSYGPVVSEDAHVAGKKREEFPTFLLTTAVRTFWQDGRITATDRLSAVDAGRANKNANGSLRGNHFNVADAFIVGSQHPKPESRRFDGLAGFGQVAKQFEQQPAERFSLAMHGIKGGGFGIQHPA